MDEATAWPPPSGLTTKIVPRKNATAQVSHATTIKAPAALVFDTLLNVSEYSKWNSWIPTVTVNSQPPPTGPNDDPNDFSRLRIGTNMTFNVVQNPSKPDSIVRVQLRVTDICTPSAPTSYLTPELLKDPTFTSDLSKVYRVSWAGRGALNEYAMQLERYHEVIITGDEECEVRSWEIFGGLLAWAVKFTQEKPLKGKVATWCADLKQKCEAEHLKNLSAQGHGE